MPDISIELHPPRDWQVFEDFCCDLARAEWAVSAQRYGNPGQKQKGVDVFASTDGGRIGIQCKKKSRHSGARLTESEIKAECRKARALKPALTRLVLATTAPRDTQVQDAAAAITERHRAEVPQRFEVQVMAWDDLVELAQKHPQVHIRWRRRLGFGAGPKIDVSRLPASRSAKLIGRQARLADLDAAWAAPSTHAISLIAVGGAGKTALVTHWLQRLADDDWRGAETVFAWSFYSQGAGEDRQASGSQFFPAAFEFLGEEMPQTKDPRAPGVRLAQLVRERNALLVLDGLEPIQYPPADATDGRIKDPAVQALVRELATSQPGLLVVTSRVEVADLREKRESSAPMIDLARLSPEAGAHLLGELGVKGKQEDLEKVAGEVHGHGRTVEIGGGENEGGQRGARPPPAQ